MQLKVLAELRNVDAEFAIILIYLRLLALYVVGILLIDHKILSSKEFFFYKYLGATLKIYHYLKVPYRTMGLFIIVTKMTFTITYFASFLLLQEVLRSLTVGKRFEEL